MITLVIAGKVQPKERPRFSKRGAYTAEKTVNYELHVKNQGREQYHGELLLTPLHVDIVVERPFLTSWSEKKKQDALLGKILPTTRPDLDNYAKALLDALNGIVWKDDSQIVSLNISKRYSDFEGAIINIEEYVPKH